MLPPSLNDALGLGAGAQQLDTRALIAERAVERFGRAVLPELAGIDQGSIGPIGSEPLQNLRADEFRPRVGAQEGWRTVEADQSGGNSSSCVVHGRPDVPLHQAAVNSRIACCQGNFSHCRWRRT